MLGLVNYASDEEEQQQEEQKPQQQQPVKTKKRKHSALKSMMQKLGVDVAALKQGKITTSLIQEDYKPKEDEMEPEAEQPPSVQNEADDDEEVDEPELKKPRLESHVQFKGPKPSEIAESIGSQPAMNEGSDFMKKFNKLINNEQEPSQQQASTAKRIPKPIFNSTISTIAPKPITTSVPAPSILGMTETKKPVVQRKRTIPIEQQQDEEDEFEVDASVYDDGTTQDEDEAQGLSEQQQVEEQLVANELPPTVESELPDDQQPLVQDEQEDLLQAQQLHQQLHQAVKPRKALPKHIQEQLDQGNIVNISGAPSEALDEAQRRKVTIERFRRQLYTQPKANVDLVSMANMLDPSRLDSTAHHGKIKHQIAYLARDLVQKELDLAERQENSSKSRNTSWRKYGWK